MELAGWLSRELCPTEFRREQLRDAVVARCRAVRLEPPTYGQLSRLINSAVRQFEERFCGVIENRLGASDGVVARLEALIGLGENGPGAVAGGGERFLYELKADPGPLGTETFRREVVKLDRVRSLGLPATASPTS